MHDALSDKRFLLERTDSVPKEIGSEQIPKSTIAALGKMHRLQRLGKCTDSVRAQRTSYALAGVMPSEWQSLQTATSFNVKTSLHMSNCTGGMRKTLDSPV